MGLLRRFLNHKGYHTLNPGYASRSASIEQLGRAVIPEAVDACRSSNAGTIHFVTHSMGAILVRWYLKHHPMADLGRVVMLSPPNQGSELVDRLKQFTFFHWLNGPAGQQLGTDSKSLPQRLGPVDYEAGIITGDRSVNPMLSRLLPGKNDGKVSVERTKVEGMTDFKVLHLPHPLIMYSPTVFQQIHSFLSQGRFF